MSKLKDRIAFGMSLHHRSIDPISTAEVRQVAPRAGGSSRAALAEAVPRLYEALESAGRDPIAFPISKRVFVSVHERGDIARSEVDRWFRDVYHDPDGTDQFGVSGNPEQVQEQLEALAATGATHLLLNPVTRYGEQLEALAEIVGLEALPEI